MSELIRVSECVSYFKTPEFMKWREKVGTREANAVGKKATTIGTRIDEIIRSGRYEAEKGDSKEVKSCLRGFLKWTDRYQASGFTFPDRITLSDIGLTGQIDFYWPEAETLIDIKAAKEIWPSNFFQLGGYRRLGIKAKRVGILRLDKEEGEFEFITNEDIGLTMEALVDAFESNFKYYQYYKHIYAHINKEKADE